MENQEVNQMKEKLADLTAEELKRVQENIQKKIEASKQDAILNPEELKDLSDINNDGQTSNNEKQVNEYLKKLDGLKQQIDFLLALVQLKSEATVSKIAANAAKKASDTINNLEKNGTNDNIDENNIDEDNTTEDENTQKIGNKTDKFINFNNSDFTLKVEENNEENFNKLNDLLNDINKNIEGKELSSYVKGKINKIKDIVRKCGTSNKIYLHDIYEIEINKYDIYYELKTGGADIGRELFESDISKFEINDKESLEKATAILNYLKNNRQEIEDKWVRPGEDSLSGLDNDYEINRFRDILSKKIMQYFQFKIPGAKKEKSKDKEETEESGNNDNTETSSINYNEEYNSRIKELLIDNNRNLSEYTDKSIERNNTKLNEEKGKLDDKILNEARPPQGDFDKLLRLGIDYEGNKELYNKILELNKLPGYEIEMSTEGGLLNKLLSEKDVKIKIDEKSIYNLTVNKNFLNVKLEGLFSYLVKNKKERLIKSFLEKLSMEYSESKDSIKKLILELDGKNILVGDKKLSDYIISTIMENSNLINLRDIYINKENEIDKIFADNVKDLTEENLEERFKSDSELIIQYLLRNINKEGGEGEKATRIYKKIIELVGKGIINLDKIKKEEFLYGNKNTEIAKTIIKNKDIIPEINNNFQNIVNSFPNKIKNDSEYIDFIIEEFRDKVGTGKEYNISDFLNLDYDLNTIIKILGKLFNNQNIEIISNGDSILTNEEVKILLLRSQRALLYINLNNFNEDEKRIIKQLQESNLKYSGAFDKIERIDSKIKEIKSETIDENRINLDEKYKNKFLEVLKKNGVSNEKEIVDILLNNNIDPVAKISRISKYIKGHEKFEKSLLELLVILNKKNEEEDRILENKIGKENKDKIENNFKDFLKENPNSRIEDFLKTKEGKELLKIASEEEIKEILQTFRNNESGAILEKNFNNIADLVEKSNKEGFELNNIADLVSYGHRNGIIFDNIPKEYEEIYGKNFENLIKATESNISNNYENTNSSSISILQVGNASVNIDKGTFNINGGENKLSQEEKALIKQNPEVAKNIINFYESLERVGLLKLWDIRENIFKGVENSFNMQFERDGNFLGERPTKILLNSILVSVGEKPIKIDISLDAFLTEFENKNGRQVTGAETQVNNYGDTRIEALFIDKFIPRGDMVGFKQIKFEDTIKKQV